MISLIRNLVLELRLPHHRPAAWTEVLARNSILSFLPALPKECVRQFYAPRPEVHKSFSEVFSQISRYFSAVHSVAHVTHRPAAIVHTLSTPLPPDVGSDEGG